MFGCPAALCGADVKNARLQWGNVRKLCLFLPEPETMSRPELPIMPLWYIETSGQYQYRLLLIFYNGRSSLDAYLPPITSDHTFTILERNHSSVQRAVDP